MGDHRASIKLEMDAHGLHFTKEMWINWSSDGDDGCDRRITEWFGECWSRALAKYDQEVYEAERERRQRETESKERADLARLLAKYEPVRR
jgi:hypothetical protein